jgi:hypothetical protein
MFAKASSIFCLFPSDEEKLNIKLMYFVFLLVTHTECYVC